MKIKLKLTLEYSAITTLLFLTAMVSVYYVSARTRSETFYRSLEQEAITKAHLFLSGKINPSIMHSIYLNNKNFINEVEVVVYQPPFHMLYHDELKSDIIKETPGMMNRILKQKRIHFKAGKYQAVGITYHFRKKQYIITAAAYDQYGITNMIALRNLLIWFSIVGISLLGLAGYILARLAFAPVKVLSDEAENITAKDINKRLPVKDDRDEVGELSIAFNRLLDRLEKAFKSQKMFVSNVSHELRTPMAALIAELELAVFKKRTSEEYEEAIQRALLDAHHVVKLITGLLNLAKADYLPEQIKMKNIRLDEQLLDARETVLKANPDYKVELIFENEAEDDSVLTVSGNSYLLTTAFINLIENNCKFSPNHTSSVHISYWEKVSILRFTDNGIGISEKDQKEIFKPFYRGENQDYTSGHGIGMALCFKIIQLHKGTIEINSLKGEGTTYIVSLPHIPSPSF
ncbi:MAG: ATP-binding protein [Prevotella sp.]|jgi:signal transduction histidine kinase|nr:ATP-binding protein [Prevotella sp.]